MRKSPSLHSIFCLPHRPKFSDFFDLCPHWVSVVRGGKGSICITILAKAFELFWFSFCQKEKRQNNYFEFLVESMQLHNLRHLFCYCTIYKEIALNWTQNTMLTSFFSNSHRAQCVRSWHFPDFSKNRWSVGSQTLQQSSRAWNLVNEAKTQKWTVSGNCNALTLLHGFIQ